MIRAMVVKCITLVRKIVRRIIGRRMADLLVRAARRTKKIGEWMGGRLGHTIGTHPLYCPLCTFYVRRFVPLLEFYPALRKSLVDSGFYLEVLSYLETLNVDSYGCPHCGSSDRDRLCWLYLRKRLRCHGSSRPQRMLDVGPSPALAKVLAKQRSLLYRRAGQIAESVDDLVDIQCMRIYEDGSFDCVICSHVLEHVADDRKAMRELCRVLAPGGWGIIMAPIVLALEETREDPTVESASERARRFGQEDHVRAYARSDYIARLREAGFRVVEVGVSDFSGPVFDLHGITRRSILYVVEKDR